MALVISLRATYSPTEANTLMLPFQIIGEVLFERLRLAMLVLANIMSGSLITRLSFCPLCRSLSGSDAAMGLVLECQALLSSRCFRLVYISSAAALVMNPWVTPPSKTWSPPMDDPTALIGKPPSLSAFTMAVGSIGLPGKAGRFARALGAVGPAGPDKGNVITRTLFVWWRWYESTAIYCSGCSDGPDFSFNPFWIYFQGL